MKVLEVYPDYCWSLQSDDHNSLARLRDAMRVADERERAARFSQVADGMAYLFLGDAVNLDFAENFFDEVVIDEAVTPVKATVIRHRAKRWVKRDGSIRVPTERRAKEGVYVPLRERFHRLTKMKWAQPRLSVIPV